MLLGVIIGIPAGLALNRLIQRRHLKEEHKSQNQVALVHLRALKAETERNSSRLEALLREIDERPIGVLFETGVWNAIPAHIVNLIPASIASAVPIGYYWLNKINTLQETALRIWAQTFDLAGPDGVSNKDKLLQKLFECIEGDCRETTKYLTEVGNLIDEHLSKLEPQVERDASSVTAQHTSR